MQSLNVSLTVRTSAAKALKEFNCLNPVLAVLSFNKNLSQSSKAEALFDRYVYSIRMFFCLILHLNGSKWSKCFKVVSRLKFAKIALSKLSLGRGWDCLSKTVLFVLLTCVFDLYGLVVSLVSNRPVTGSDHSNDHFSLMAAVSH